MFLGSSMGGGVHTIKNVLRTLHWSAFSSYEPNKDDYLRWICSFSLRALLRVGKIWYGNVKQFVSFILLWQSLGLNWIFISLEWNLLSFQTHCYHFLRRISIPRICILLLQHILSWGNIYLQNQKALKQRQPMTWLWFDNCFRSVHHSSFSVVAKALLFPPSCSWSTETTPKIRLKCSILRSF